MTRAGVGRTSGPAPGTACPTRWHGARGIEGLGSRPTSSCEAIRRQSSSRPDLQNEFVGAVIGAMDSSAELSAQILNNPELSQKLLGELVPLIYHGLKSTA